MKSKLRNAIVPIYEAIERFCGCLFPVAHSKRLYRKTSHKKCNLKNPETLNEKLMYCKFHLYWKNQLVNQCADKYKVREFVSEKSLSHILNPIYGCWNKSSEIEWDKLPNKFVLKLNFGSGYNLVCLNKDTFDTKKACRQLDKWMKRKYGLLTAEQGIYSEIEKKIICEKYIDNFENTPPNDYKFFCSYGDVKMLFVASDRFDGNTKFDYYTPDWKWINVKNCHPNKGPMEKPKNFDKMLEYASRLSRNFPLVRIDFYDNDGEIVFGEITFTHFGCIHPFDPDLYDKEFGILFPDVRNCKISNE